MEIDVSRRIPEATKLLYPDVTFVGPLAFKHKKESLASPVLDIKDTGRELNEESLSEMLKEWNSVYRLLCQLVGKENIFLSETSVVSGTRTDYGIKWTEHKFPDAQAMGSKRIPFFDHYGRSWTRDALTLLNNQVYVNGKHWTFKDSAVKVSPLGDGGTVLNQGNSVLVSETTWGAAKRGDIAELINSGFRFGVLPSVDPAKQEYDFNHESDHIDGHATLLRGQGDALWLVVAESYVLQGKGAKKKIQEAATYVGAKVVVVDDADLPPLSFNVLQLLDGSVIMTKGALDLEQVLSDIVGREKLYNTDMELRELPTLGTGSIRCLTNYLPDLPEQYWLPSQPPKSA